VGPQKESMQKARHLLPAYNNFSKRNREATMIFSRTRVQRRGPWQAGAPTKRALACWVRAFRHEKRLAHPGSPKRAVFAFWGGTVKPSEHKRTTAERWERINWIFFRTPVACAEAQPERVKKTPAKRKKCEQPARCGLLLF